MPTSSATKNTIPLAPRLTVLQTPLLMLLPSATATRAKSGMRKRDCTTTERNPNSDYNKVNEEIAEFKTKVNVGIGTNELSTRVSNALLAEPIGAIELPSNSVGNRYRFFVNDVAFKAMGSSPHTNVRINPTLLRLQPGGAMRNFDSIILSLPYRR